MCIPDREQANDYLIAAGRMNAGEWVNHSRYAALAAERIAEKIPGLDNEKAYVLGLLHDIGRRDGVSDLLHILKGYEFMITEGFPLVARISLTHSFVLKDAHKARNNWDGSEDQLLWLQNYLDAIEYDLYDRLIQLCDALAHSSGYWLIEKRIVDVAIRRGTSQYSMERWKKILLIKDEFDQLIGGNIYQLLPGVIKNTFGFK